MKRLLLSMFVGFVLCCWAVAARAADSGQVKQGLSRLFEAGWEPTLKARQTATTEYEAVSALAPTDQRIVYAYALVHIKQRRYPEATKLVTDVLDIQPTNVQAWRTKVWLSMVTKNYAGALVDMEKLSALVPPPAADPAKEERIREVAGFLGRMFGFLEGPVDDVSANTNREKAKEQILARIGDTRLEAFEAGRKKVADKFASLTGEREEKEQADKNAAEEERDRKAKELAEKEDQIAGRKDELADRKDKLVAEARAEMDKLSKDDQPLAQQQLQIEATANPIQNEWDRNLNRMRFLQDQLDAELSRSPERRDEFNRVALQRDINQYRIVLNRLDTQLETLRRQRNLIMMQRQELRRRASELQATYGSQLGRVENELTTLNKDEKRVEGQKKTNQKSVTGKTGRVRALSAQVVALSTYEEFPLDAERQRILDAYK